MKLHNARLLSTALALLFGASGTVFAQDAQIEPGSERPMYAIVKHGLQQPQNQAQSRILAASTPLQTWNGSFTYKGKSNAFTMVGTNPINTVMTATVTITATP